MWAGSWGHARILSLQGCGAPSLREPFWFSCQGATEEKEWCFSNSCHQGYCWSQVSVQNGGSEMVTTPFLEIFCLCLWRWWPPSHVPGVPTSIACSVQIQKGKAWEMCLCAVTSGRQRVDMWKQCLTVMIPVSYWTAPWMMSGIDAALLNALASSPRTDSTRKGFEILCWAPPPMCLPDVTTRNQIPQAYYKRSNTGGGNGLEIG